jgi:hypothetical protein
MRVLILLLALMAPVPAIATVVLPADFATVVNGADVIVSGRVVDVRSGLTERRSIESLVTVAISETVKGATGGTITFRVPNGTVGRYRRITLGAPEFVEGDRVVLFLRSRAPSIPTLFGLSQGVYRIGSTDGGEMVLPAPVMARGVAAERVVRGDPTRKPVPLATFLGMVRAAMEVR